MSPYWSWVLMAVGVLGLILAGRKMWQGWLIGLLAQVLWIAYALATNQPGFLVSALVYGAVYARNAWKWYVQRQWDSPTYDQFRAAMERESRIKHPSNPFRTGGKP